MAPNVTSTSLPCHLRRVWHKQLNLSGLCSQGCSWGDDPSHREHPHCLEGPAASPGGMRGTEGQGTEAASPQIQLGHLPGSNYSCCCTHLQS